MDETPSTGENGIQLDVISTFFQAFDVFITTIIGFANNMLWNILVLIFGDNFWTF